MAGEGEGLLPADIWMESRLVNCRELSAAAERERGMREEQQSARNVASARGIRVVSGGHQTLHAMALREHRDGVFMFLALLGEV